MIACLLVFAATVVGYSGDGLWQVISIVRDELMFVGAWIATAGLLGWTLLRWWQIEAGLPTAAGLGLGIYSLAGLGLGLAGGLNRWTAALFPLVSIVIWSLSFYAGREALRGKAMARLEAWLRARAGWGALWIVAMPFLGMAVVGATLPPGVLWPDDPHWYDVLEYHLQVPREWYEARRIVPLLHNVFSYFPFNVEVHYLLFMHLRGGPWGAMYAAQFLMLGYMLLMVGAVAGVASSGAGRAIAGVAAATTPWIVMLGSVAYDEGGMLLYGALAVGWVVRGMRLAGEEGPHPSPLPEYWERGKEGAAPMMVLAGFFAGLACGVKLTAVPVVLVGLPVVAVVAGFQRGRVARWVLGLGVYVVVGLLVFSPWLLRNWRWAGNPVFPEGMSVLGRGHFSQMQEMRWELAHAPRADQHSAGAHVRAAWEQIVIDWRYGYLLLPMALAAGCVAWRDRRARLLLLLLLALGVFWIGFTHLQSRFFVLGIPLGAMLLGHVGRERWLRVAGALVVLAALGGWIGVRWPNVGEAPLRQGLHPILSYYAGNCAARHLAV